VNIAAYRLTNTIHAATAFDGEGARLYGGRWNSVGTRMVYVAGSRSLATLEVLVHTEDITIIEGDYSIIPVSIPSDIVLEVSNHELPDGRSSPEPIAEAQIFGDAWVREHRSAVMRVPSAVTNGERNYLLNPAHSDFSKIAIGPPEPFRLDPRLR
jgi:RES domain-containing protein